MVSGVTFGGFLSKIRDDTKLCLSIGYTSINQLQKTAQIGSFKSLQSFKVDNNGRQSHQLRPVPQSVAEQLC